MDGSSRPASEQSRGVTFHRVPTTQFGRSNLVGRGFDYASFYASLWRAVNRIARPGDVLVAKTDPPMLGALAMSAAKRRQSHLVNWLQDLYPEVAIRLRVPLIDGALGRALGRLRDASLRSATANVVIGERMAAKDCARSGCRRTVSTSSPTGATTKPFAPAGRRNNPLRRAWGLEDKFVVGYSGNLGRAHEFETILGAARKLWDEPGIVFLVIGGGHFVEEFSPHQQASSRPKLSLPPYQDQATLNYSLGVPDLHWISLKPELEASTNPQQVLQHRRRGAAYTRHRGKRRRTRDAGFTA